MNTYLHLLKINALILFSMLGLSFCANQAVPVKETSLMIVNTGTYPMLSPEVCYYNETDPNQCEPINREIKNIAAGTGQEFTIRAEQRVRLVLPFDHIQRSRGVTYRPNCHILIDWVPSQSKHYVASGQITANLTRPENGFNCASAIHETGVDGSNKQALKEHALTNIRYRVPRRGEKPANYVDNYNWENQ